MKNYGIFLRSNLPQVGFGFVFTLFSSLGQTFLISLYVPHILRDLGLSNSAFGTMYAAATISSSLLLMAFGGRIDRRPLNSYIYRTLFLLAAASLALGLVRTPLLLPPALLGLRFAGQGLMSHISQTVMGRRFQADRGKALSLSTLGFPVGEMIFPVLITLLIPLVGWRVSLAVNAGVLIAVMLPLLRILPLEELSETAEPKNSRAPGKAAGKAAQREVLREPQFWRLMPVLVLLTGILSGILFYQLVMVETRGWSPELYSLLFSGYAAARFFFGLYGGSLVDRFTARRLFVLHLLPMISGLLVLAWSSSPWGAAFYLLTAGVSIGSNSPIKSAVMAEIHGVENLGGVRSVYTAFSVFGTALGPMLFGTLLDRGISFGAIFLGAAAVLSLALLPALRISFQPAAVRA